MGLGQDLRGLVKMNVFKKLIFAVMLALTLTFTAVAQPQQDLMQGKPPERPKEKEKDPPKRDNPRPSDDKKDKRRKPYFIL